MKSKIIAGFVVMTIFGAGCVGIGTEDVPPYIPGQIPTEAQLQVMTDQEKTDGMNAMVENVSLPEMTQEEKAAEVQTSIDQMKEGDTIRLGDFEGRLLHPAAGTVRVVEVGGKHMLVFSNEFSVLMGPSLYVYLSSETSPQKAELVMDEGFEIAKLKSVNGVQVYELPDDVNFENGGVASSVASIHSVVIISKPFKYIFASAGF